MAVRLENTRRKRRQPTWQEVADSLAEAGKEQKIPLNEAEQAGDGKSVTPVAQPIPVTRETLRVFIDANCIKRVPKGSRELPSLEGDGFYDWQFYLRSAVLVPQFLSLIAQSFWRVYIPRFKDAPFQIAGVEQASLPIFTTILLFGAQYGVPLRAFTIRKERKTYGMRNLIEGIPHPTLPVVIIDDLTSESHRTMWHAIHALSLEKLRPYSSCFVLVRKQMKNSNPVIPTSIGNVMIESMFTLDDFVLTHEDYAQGG